MRPDIRGSTEMGTTPSTAGRSASCWLLGVRDAAVSRPGLFPCIVVISAKRGPEQGGCNATTISRAVIFGGCLSPGCRRHGRGAAAVLARHILRRPSTGEIGWRVDERRYEGDRVSRAAVRTSARAASVLPAPCSGGTLFCPPHNGRGYRGRGDGAPASFRQGAKLGRPNRA